MSALNKSYIDLKNFQLLQPNITTPNDTYNKTFLNHIGYLYSLRNIRMNKNK